MANRQDVIESLLETKLIETCVDYQLKKSPEDYQNKGDIIQDCWLWLLEYDEDKLLDAYNNNHMNALITGYLSRQIFSKNSPYYAKYKRFNSRTTEITPDIINTNYDVRFRAITKSKLDTEED